MVPSSESDINVSFSLDDESFNGAGSIASDTDTDPQGEEFSTELFISEDALTSGGEDDNMYGSMTSDLLTSDDSYAYSNWDETEDNESLGTIVSDSVVMDVTCGVSSSKDSEKPTAFVTNDIIVSDNTCTVVTEQEEPLSVVPVAESVHIPDNTCIVVKQDEQGELAGTIVNDLVTQDNICMLQPQANSQKNKNNSRNNVNSQNNTVVNTNLKPENRKKNVINVEQKRRKKIKDLHPSERGKGRIDISPYRQKQHVPRSPGPRHNRDRINTSPFNKGSGSKSLSPRPGNDRIQNSPFKKNLESDKTLAIVNERNIKRQNDRIKTSPFKQSDMPHKDTKIAFKQRQISPNNVEVHDRKTCKNRIKTSPFTQRDVPGVTEEKGPEPAAEAPSLPADTILLSMGESKIKSSPFKQKDSSPSLMSSPVSTDDLSELPGTPLNRVQSSPFKNKMFASKSEASGFKTVANLVSEQVEKFEVPPCDSNKPLDTPVNQNGNTQPPATPSSEQTKNTWSYPVATASTEEKTLGTGKHKSKWSAAPAPATLPVRMENLEDKPPLVVRQKAKWTPSPENNSEGKLPPVLNRLRKYPVTSTQKWATAATEEDNVEVKNKLKKSMNTKYPASHRSEPDGKEVEVDGVQRDDNTMPLKGRDAPFPIRHVPSSQDMDDPLPIRHVPSSLDISCSDFEKDSSGGFFKNKLILFGRNPDSQNQVGETCKKRMWTRDSGLQAPVRHGSVRHGNVSFLAKAFGFQTKEKTNYPIAPMGVKRKGSKKGKKIWSEKQVEVKKEESMATVTQNIKVTKEVSEKKTQLKEKGSKSTNSKSFSLSFSMTKKK